jgi:hypothetical protein
MPTKFHKNLPTGSKVDGGGLDRQDSDLISLLPFFESRLKKTIKICKYSCSVLQV